MPFAAAFISQVTLALDIHDNTPVVNQFAEISAELERRGRDRPSCDERAEKKARRWKAECNEDAACEARVATWLEEEKSICDMERGCEQKWARKINWEIWKCAGDADCESFVTAIADNENLCGECKAVDKALSRALRQCDETDFVACTRDIDDDVAEALEKCECKDAAREACADAGSRREKRRCIREFMETCPPLPE